MTNAEHLRILELLAEVATAMAWRHPPNQQRILDALDAIQPDISALRQQVRLPDASR